MADMPSNEQGRAKIPRLGEGSQSYPPWLENAQHLDLARTVAVAGIPSSGMCAAVSAAFIREFGQDSLDECAAPEPFSKVIYVRFKADATGQGQVGEERTGYQCAYEAVEALDQVGDLQPVMNCKRLQ